MASKQQFPLTLTFSDKTKILLRFSAQNDIVSVCISPDHVVLKQPNFGSRKIRLCKVPKRLLISFCCRPLTVLNWSILLEAIVKKIKLKKTSFFLSHLPCSLRQKIITKLLFVWSSRFSAVIVNIKNTIHLTMVMVVFGYFDLKVYDKTAFSLFDAIFGPWKLTYVEIVSISL